MILHEAQHSCLIYLPSQAELTNLASKNEVLLHSLLPPSHTPQFHFTSMMFRSGRDNHHMQIIEYQKYIISTFLTAE